MTISNWVGRGGLGGGKGDATDHHKLLQLVKGVKMSTTLQILAGGNEVVAPVLQAGVKPLQETL